MRCRPCQGPTTASWGRRSATCSVHTSGRARSITVATQGAVRLEGPLRRLQIPPSVIERLTVERIAKLQPSVRRLDDEQWFELCRLVMILARFEQYFRAGHVVLPHIAEPIITHSGDLGELALRLASEPSMRDLDMLGRITLEDHLGIRDARELAIGPNFAQSGALGGADADLIYDGTLLDLKSSSQARIVGRDEVWQLIGYLLADTDHCYGIARVGFAALRRRRSIFWSADDLIDQLSAGPPHAVEQLRDEFAALLARLPEGWGFLRSAVRSKVRST